MIYTLGNLFAKVGIKKNIYFNMKLSTNDKIWARIVIMFFLTFISSSAVDKTKCFFFLNPSVCTLYVLHINPSRFANGIMISLNEL